MDGIQNTIADILVSQNVISPDQANLVTLESINTGQPQEEVLLHHRFVTEDQIAPARAKFLGVPFVDLKDRGISPEVLNFIPETVAVRYQALPFEYNKDKNKLSVAMADPLDPQALE